MINRLNDIFALKTFFSAYLKSIFLEWTSLQRHLQHFTHSYHHIQSKSDANQKSKLFLFLN